VLSVGYYVEIKDYFIGTLLLGSSLDQYFPMKNGIYKILKDNDEKFYFLVREGKCGW
jgi:hypothetical protein